MSKKINQYHKDCKLGDEGEKAIKPMLEEFFNTNFKKTSRYHTFDFISENRKIYIELKTRRCCKNQYPSTMIPYHKIIKGFDIIKKAEENKKKKKIYIVFKFTDKTCYFRLKKDTFNKEKWVRKGGRFDRGRPEVKEYAYIPVELLIDM